MDSSVVGSGPSGEPDLAALPIVGITRRRAAILLGALLAGWIIILFARQVSEASAATGRAETMVTENAARKSEIAGLERELQRIQQPRYVVQQARGYGLGSSKEIAFTLGANAPSLPPNAPGSAGLRVGARICNGSFSSSGVGARNSGTPLESWLTLLFGPGD